MAKEKKAKTEAEIKDALAVERFKSGLYRTSAIIGYLDQHNSAYGELTDSLKVGALDGLDIGAKELFGRDLLSNREYGINGINNLKASLNDMTKESVEKVFGVKKLKSDYKEHLDTLFGIYLQGLIEDPKNFTGVLEARKKARKKVLEELCEPENSRR